MFPPESVLRPKSKDPLGVLTSVSSHVRRMPAALEQLQACEELVFYLGAGCAQVHHTTRGWQ